MKLPNQKGGNKMLSTTKVTAVFDFDGRYVTVRTTLGYVLQYVDCVVDVLDITIKM